MTAVYCPGIDKEMKKSIDEMIRKEWIDKAQVYSATNGGLGQIEPDRRLYIMAHGNKVLPIFQTKLGRWTAEAMVKLLVQNGLRKDHRDIDLIVCGAGASVSDIKTLNARLPQYEKLLQAEGNEQKHKKLLEEWTKKVGNSKPTQYFGKTEKKPEMMQVVPLAAQFAGMLKAYGFTNFRVICYRLPVSQVFSQAPPGKIPLDTRGAEDPGKYGDYREAIVKKYTIEWH